jgi:hypothetical protein
MGFLSDLLTPGNEFVDRASGQAGNAVFTGGRVSGPGGISAGFDFSGNRATSSLGLGSFAPLLQQLQGLGGLGARQAQSGLPPELAALGEDVIGQLGANTGDFSSIFQQALPTATADPFDLGADISSRLRGLSERRNQRRFNKFTDRLQRTGNLTSSVGTQRAGELEALEREEGLKLDLAGLEAGRGIQGDAMQRLLAAFQGTQTGAGNQLAAGRGLFGDLLQSQAQGANIALSGAQGASGLAQLPLAFQTALLNAGTSASNSLLGAAGVNVAGAEQVKSPVLELVKAVAAAKTAGI